MIKSTYNAMRHVSPRNDWASLVWFPNNIPKHSFITWLAMRNALKTMDKLVAWGKRNTNFCEFCYAEVETISHLFFECHTPRAIWNFILTDLQLNHNILPWQEEVKWCIDKFKGKNPMSIIRKLAFNAFIYCIWEERNARLYKGTWKFDYEVYTRIKTLVRKKSSCVKFKTEDTAEARSFLTAWDCRVEFFH